MRNGSVGCRAGFSPLLLFDETALSMFEVAG